MKYVMVGKQDDFQFLGLLSASFEKDDGVTELSCKLESGYTLDLYGDTISEVFTEFLKSNVMVAMLLNEKGNEKEDDYLELLDSENRVVYRY